MYVVEVGVDTSFGWKRHLRWDGCAAGGQEANLVAATTQKIQTCIFVPKLTAKGKVTYKEDGGA